MPGEGRGGPRGGRAAAPGAAAPGASARAAPGGGGAPSPSRPAGTVAGPDGETRRCVPAARPAGDRGRSGAAVLGAGVQLLWAVRLHRRAAAALEHRPAAGRDLPLGGAGEPPCLPQRSLPGHPLLRPDQGEGSGGGSGGGTPACIPPLHGTLRASLRCVCRAPCVLSYACVCAATRACLPLHARTPARIHVPACASPGKRSRARPGSLGSAGRGRRPGPAATGEVVPGGLGFGERVRRSPALGVPHPACGTCPSLPTPAVLSLLFMVCSVAPGSLFRASGSQGKRRVKTEVLSLRFVHLKPLVNFYMHLRSLPVICFST